VSFEGQVAIVTGGSRGIGRAIVRSLAEAGARVAFTYASNEDAANRLVAELEHGGTPAGHVVAFQGDAADAGRAAEIVKDVRGSFGRVDILVNNAGVTRDKLLVRMSESDWDSVLDANLKSVYNYSKPAVTAMLKERSGTVLNVSSISGLTGMPGQTNYSASKAGMIGFTKALAKEVAKAGITVNALALGFIDTDMTAELAEEFRRQALAEIPIGRYGTAEEVAAIARFLVSSEAAYITGQVIQVDGGIAI
jgi:3-oxoacyl-[acyl-carrier protein] reductase